MLRQRIGSCHILAEELEALCKQYLTARSIGGKDPIGQ